MSVDVIKQAEQIKAKGQRAAELPELLRKAPQLAQDVRTHAPAHRAAGNAHHVVECADRQRNACPLDSSRVTNTAVNIDNLNPAWQLRQGLVDARRALRNGNWGWGF